MDTASGKDDIKPDYLERLKAFVEPAFSWDAFLEAIPTAQPEGILISDVDHYWNCKHPRGIENVRKMIRDVDNGILIIENVTIDLISVLGNKYDVGLLLFPQHFYWAKYDTPLGAWKSLINPDPSRTFHKSWHLDCGTGGEFRVSDSEGEPQSPWFGKKGSGPSIRISFYSPNPNLILVLIGGSCSSMNYLCLDDVATPNDLRRLMPDASSHLQSWSVYPTAKLMYGVYNRPWDREMLFSCLGALLEETAPPSIVLNVICWHLSVHSLHTTLELIGRQVSALSYDSINKPHLETLARLNECRKVLQQLRENISHRSLINDGIMEWAAETHARICDTVRANGRGEFESMSVFKKHRYMDERAAEFLTSLTESFQLLIGAISVIDSDINKKQAERSTMLTVMAAIYLPLSLGTGIFGMNVKEINGDGSNAHWWAVVVAIAIIFFPSVLFVVYIFTRGRIRAWRSKRKMLDIEA